MRKKKGNETQLYSTNIISGAGGSLDVLPLFQRGPHPEVKEKHGYSVLLGDFELTGLNLLVFSEPWNR